MASSVRKIPIIDLGPLGGKGVTGVELNETILSIEHACKNVGFFYVKNHGIPSKHIKDVFASSKIFFDLSREEKMKIHMGKSKIFRGYTPIGTELTNEKRDWNESIDFGLDLASEHPDVQAGEALQGPNQWPEYPPELKRLLELHWDLMIVLGRKITQGLALSLGLAKDYFTPFTNRTQCAMRILHYPKVGGSSADNIGYGIGAHIDYGFLTILAQDEVGGLEVQNADGEWIAAPYIPGSFVINIGHMIQRWTNDFYQATLHRVRSSHTKDRYSLPFFYEPNFDTVVAPLEKFCSVENPARYQDFHFGNYLLNKYKTSYAESLKES